MKLIILRIENRIVNCQLDDGTIIDIAQRWFNEDIQEGDTIEFDMHDKMILIVKNRGHKIIMSPIYFIALY